MRFGQLVKVIVFKSENPSPVNVSTLQRGIGRYPLSKIGGRFWIAEEKCTRWKREEKSIFRWLSINNFNLSLTFFDVTMKLLGINLQDCSASSLFSFDLRLKLFDWVTMFLRIFTQNTQHANWNFQSVLSDKSLYNGCTSKRSALFISYSDTDDYTTNLRLPIIAGLVLESTIKTYLR